jgi:GNAT superfamily N-acetyltransferase
MGCLISGTKRYSCFLTKFLIANSNLIAISPILRILTHDELPESANAQVQLMALSANWGIFDFDQIKKAREAGLPTADYDAIYAVEGSEVLARVEVYRVDVETTNGLERMTGISGVLTRRDKSRQGLSRQLFLDVHRTEKESGMHHSILWTQRNNKAHNLYESLGYRDVYGPVVALVKSKGQKIQTQETAVKIRDTTTQDVQTIDSLHAKITSGRLGFSHRFKGFWNLWINIIGSDKASDFKLFTKQGDDEPIGYAWFQQNVGWVRSNEVVIEPQYSEEAVELLEREAKENWLALGGTFVIDNRGLLTKRGYTFADYSYSTLMGVSLDDPNEDMVKLLGTNDKGFVCHNGDHF